MRLKFDLKSWLRDQNLTQKQFARRAGISPKTLTNMLAGKNVGPKTRDKIRVEVGLPNRELWGDVE